MKQCNNAKRAKAIVSVYNRRTANRKLPPTPVVMPDAIQHLYGITMFEKVAKAIENKKPQSAFAKLGWY